MNEYFYIDFQTEILLLLPPLLDSLSLSTLPPIIIPVFFSLFSFFFPTFFSFISLVQKSDATLSESAITAQLYFYIYSFIYHFHLLLQLSGPSDFFSPSQQCVNDRKNITAISKSRGYYHYYYFLTIEKLHFITNVHGVSMLFFLFL